MKELRYNHLNVRNLLINTFDAKHLYKVSTSIEEYDIPRSFFLQRIMNPLSYIIQEWRILE
jgi:hypothetical protein